MGNKAKSQEFIFLMPDGSASSIFPKGRDAWALNRLLDAGRKGCTPLDNPAPKWSVYIHKLRKVYGVNIETIDEPHSGEFAGTHARYVLRSNIERVMESEAA